MLCISGGNAVSGFGLGDTTFGHVDDSAEVGWRGWVIGDGKCFPGACTHLKWPAVNAKDN